MTVCRYRCLFNLRLAALCLLITTMASSPVLAQQGEGPLRVLFFTGTTEGAHRHEEAIQVSLNLAEQIGGQRGWELTYSEDLQIWTDLDPYDVVVLMNSGRNVISGDGKRNSFLKWLGNGGGVVSFHFASFIGRSWPKANDVFLGATNARGVSFDDEPTINMQVNTAHPTMGDLTSPWQLTVEVYPWDADPSSRGFTPLLVANGIGAPATPQHPIAWAKKGNGTGELGTGRAWHTNIGHFAQSYYEPNFVRMFTQAVEWAGGEDSPAPVTTVPSPIQEPFLEQVGSLASRTEAERFDVGGDGVSYHDRTAGNSFDLVASHLKFRETDVDLYQDNDLVYITDIENGEWVEYSLNGGSGDYRIRLRARGGTADDRVRILENGSPVAEIPVVPGAAWGNTPWVDLSLNGGTPGVLRFEFVGGGFEFDSFEMRTVATSTGNDDSGSTDSESDAWRVDAFPNPTSVRSGGATSVIVTPGLESAVVNLSVFDLLGRHVATLFDGLLRDRGPQTFRFDHDLPGGVYLIKLSGSGLSRSTTLVVSS